MAPGVDPDQIAFTIISGEGYWFTTSSLRFLDGVLQQKWQRMFVAEGDDHYSCEYEWRDVPRVDSATTRKKT